MERNTKWVITMILKQSFETLNLNYLHALEVFDIKNDTRNYHVSNSMGQGCMGDAPGYPTYFLRSIYTSRGNEPCAKGAPVTVILDENDLPRIVDRNGWSDEKRERIIKELWNPLPI